MRNTDSLSIRAESSVPTMGIRKKKMVIELTLLYFSSVVQMEKAIELSSAI